MQDFDIMSVSAEYPGWTDEQRRDAAEFDAATAVYVSGEPRAADFDAIDGKAMIVHDMGRTVGMADMAGTCKQHMKWLYLDATPSHMAAAISAGLGKTVTADDLLWASLQLQNARARPRVQVGRGAASTTPSPRRSSASSSPRACSRAGRSRAAKTSKP